MKPSDNDLDTILNQQMQDINLNTTQTYTHQTLTNIDITDIRLARLHIQTNPSSSEDDNTNTPTNHIQNKQNSNILINPWQDMPTSSQTNHSETKSIHKNSDDNSDYHYSNTLLYNHEQDNSFNKTSTLWNRNANTIVWTKQNLMNRIVDPTTLQTHTSTSQNTITDVWSKRSYDFHRKHHTSSNSSSHTEFMINKLNNQQKNSVTNPNYNFSPKLYPRATADGISRLLKIDSNKVDFQHHIQHKSKNSDKLDIHLPSPSLNPSPSPIKTPSKRKNKPTKLNNNPFGDVLQKKSSDVTN